MNYEEISDEEMLQRVGAKLKEIRLEQNVKQKELSEKAGLSMFSISQMETGHNTSMQSIIQVLRALERMDLLDAFINNNKVEDNPLAERQRVSRTAPFQQKKPIYYLLNEGDDDYMMAAESEEDYGYGKNKKGTRKY
ncbi:MAG: helix-turn-helix transcriptional regulator [Bacteroidales bacterium]|nr:helix-turn-helix transcriptional regulator [Bacteroidales bacterium]